MARGNSKKAEQAAAEVYVVKTGMNYGDPEVRREAGEEVTDIPAASVPQLLADGHIVKKGGDSDAR